MVEVRDVLSFLSPSKSYDLDYSLDQTGNLVGYTKKEQTFSDQSSRVYAPVSNRTSTNVDARSVAQDYTYAPTIVYGSGSATGAALKKEVSASSSPQTPTTIAVPQQFTSSPGFEKKESGAGISNLTLIVAAAAVAAVFILGGDKK